MAAASGQPTTTCENFFGYQLGSITQQSSQWQIVPGTGQGDADVVPFGEVSRAVEIDLDPANSSNTSYVEFTVPANPADVVAIEFTYTPRFDLATQQYGDSKYAFELSDGSNILFFNSDYSSSNAPGLFRIEYNDAGPNGSSIYFLYHNDQFVESYQLFAGLKGVSFCGNAGKYWVWDLCYETTSDTGIDCNSAIPLLCGGAEFGNPFFANNNVEDYCNQYINLTGPEVVYSIFPNTTGRHTIYLETDNTGADLDMFLLTGDCDATQCIASSDGASPANIDLIDVVLNANQQYYLVVDGDNNGGSTADQSVFGIYMNCESDCEPQRELECNEPDSWLNGDGQSRFAFYQCEDADLEYSTNYWAWEVTYRFTPESDGDYTFTLDDMIQGTDLDIFILTECDPLSCIATSSVVSSIFDFEVTASLQEGVTYIIVIDGNDGDFSPFVITVTSPACEEDICDNSYALWCEDFEDLSVGDSISMSSTWETPMGRVPCLIAADNTGDQYLDIQPSSSRGAQLNIDDQSGTDATVILSVDLLLGAGNGIQTQINSNSINQFISLNVAQQFSGLAYQLQITDQLFIDYTFFAFDPNSLTNFSFYLNKLTNNLKVTIDGQLVADVDNSGVTAFTDFFIDDALTTVSSVRLYNVCLNICQDSGDICSNAIELHCGSTILANTGDGFNNLTATDYEGCPNFDAGNASFDGPELVFEVNKIVNLGYLNVTMFHGTLPSENLSMFLLNECGEPISCLTKGNNFTSANLVFGEYTQDNPEPLPAGRYYIVVDGSEADVQGEFSISVSCLYTVWDSGDLISCGQTLDDEEILPNPDRGNSQSIYYLGSSPYPNAIRGNISAENIYPFTLTETQTVSITLDDFGPNDDFELYLSHQTCPGSTLSPEFCVIASSTLPSGQSESITNVTLEPGNYLIIVDGYRAGNSLLPTSGTYDLTLSGCEVDEEEVIFELGEACGPVGGVAKVPVRVQNFQDIRAFNFDLNLPISNAYRFVGISDPHPAFEEVNDNSAVINDHRLIVGWASNDFSFISVDDNTIIFYIDVEILQPLSSNVSITGTNPDIVGLSPVFGTIISGAVCSEDIATISGRVYNELGIAAPGVAVTASGPVTMQTTTDANGEYQFEDIPSGMYDVSCFDNSNLKQGVSIIDVVLIRGHFLEKLTLDSDYKLIAGDIERNAQVNIIDASSALGIFLEKLTSLSNNTSWRFVPASQDISADPLSLSITGSATITASANTTNIDFIAVKIADVTNDALLKGQQNPTDTRQMPLVLQIPESFAVKGEVVTIPLQQSNFSDVTALGFELTWDSEFMSLESIDQVALPGFDDGNYTLTDGRLIVGWNDSQLEPVDLGDSNVLNLSFRVSDTAEGMSTISFSNVEATDATFQSIETMGVDGSIDAVSTSVSSEHQLPLIAYPNPFTNAITIELREQMSVHDTRVEIYDGRGQLLQTTSTSQSELVLTQKELPHKGMYLIKVTNDTRSNALKILRL